MHFNSLLFTLITVIVFTACSSDTSIDGKKANVVDSPKITFTKEFITAFDDGVNGLEPWIVHVDGTSNLLKNVNLLPANSNPIFLYNRGDLLYFMTQKNNQIDRLWITDGSEAGTKSLMKFPTLTSSSNVICEMIDGVLYFSRRYNKTIMWRSDGTPEGTYKISEYDFVGNYFKHNGALYFSVIGSEAGLYKINDQEEIEQVLKVSNIRGAISFNGAIYFSTIYDLYRWNEIESRVTKLANISATRFVASSTHLFFCAGKNLYAIDKSSDSVVTTLFGEYKKIDNLKSCGVIVDGHLFYYGFDVDHGSELWISDGTVTQTRMVKDIRVGVQDTSISSLIGIGNKVYFSARDNDNKGKLFESNGTKEGTFGSIVGSGSFGNSITSIRKYNNNLAMIRFDNQSKNLISVDGSTIVQLTNNDNLNHGEIGELDVVNGKLLFTNKDAEHGNELWVSEGTNSSSHLLWDFSVGNLGSLVYSNYADGRIRTPFVLEKEGLFYFYASQSMTPFDKELLKSDGTLEGTDIFLDKERFDPDVEELIDDNGTFYLAISEKGKSNVELYRGDGTKEGTQLIKELRPQSGAYNRSSYPSSFHLLNKILFFTAYDGVERKLWRSDGTPEGTYKLHDKKVSLIKSYQDAIYFVSDAESALYKTDGTVVGTIVVKEIPNGSKNAGIKKLTVSGAYLYFTAQPSDSTRVKLWKSDGSEMGTGVVADIQTSNAYTTINLLTDVNGTLYFNVNDGIHGINIWTTDGSAEGTHMLKDIVEGGSSSDAKMTSVRVAEGKLFCLIDDDVHGAELWVSNGTQEGTVMVLDINEGEESANIIFDKVIDGKLMFNAFDGTKMHLYASDGTAEGTVIVIP